MLKNKNLSINKIIGGQQQSEYEDAIVVAVGNKTVDIKMLSGGIFRRVPISGSAKTGDTVKVLFLKGKPSIVSGASNSASGGSQVIINAGAITAEPVGEYAPSPHSVLNSIHHSWPSDPADRFLATTATAGAPAFRPLALSDFQSITDNRYALRSRSIIAGAGLTGTSTLAADVTLAIGQGDGITVLDDQIEVNLAATSGLTKTGGLAIADSIAGTGLGITNKVLSVSASNTIQASAPSFQGLQAEADGLRLYASSNPGASSHILSSSATGSLTLPLFVASTSLTSPLLTSATGTTLQISSGSGADITLNPSSNSVKLLSGKYIESNGYASQTTGMRITHSGEGDFRYIYTDELHAKSFIADLEQALAGGQIISKSVAILTAAYTLPAANSSSAFTVNDLPSARGMRVFETGDFIGFRLFDRSAGSLSIGWAWGTVSSYVDNQDGTQTWTFTRSASPNEGTASGVVGKDSIVLDFGKSGNGYYEVSAIDGLQGANSPYSQIVTWSTHPSSRLVRSRLGNLRGIFGAQGSSVYSLVIESATGGTFLIKIGEEETSAIAYNASAATVASAINATTVDGATVTLNISGAVYTYTITIPSTYASLPLSVNAKNITGGASLDVRCTLTSQTDSEFGLFAGTGTQINDRYIRASDQVTELRNTPLRLYDGSSETVRISAGNSNNSPSFAMGSPLATGPVSPSSSSGIWMGLSGGVYQFRVGSVDGTNVTSGMRWTGSQLDVIGSLRLSGSTYSSPSTSGLYGDSSRLGYYNATAGQGGWRSWFDSSGNLTLRAAPVSSGTAATGIEFTASNGVLKGGYYTAAAGPAYGAFVTQWQTSASDGSILAGGGEVILNSDGIRIKDAASQSPNAYNTITFGDRSTNNYGQIFSWGSGKLNIESNTSTSSSRINLSGESIAAQGRLAAYYKGLTVRSLVDDSNGWSADYDQLFIYGSNTLAGSGLSQSGQQNIDYVPLKLQYRTTLGGFTSRSTNIDTITYQPSGISYPFDFRISTNNTSADNIKAIFYIRSQNIDGASPYLTLDNVRGSVVSNVKLIADGILEAQKTQLLRYKYGPSGFDDANTQPYLKFYISTGSSGRPMGAFLISFTGRENGNAVAQELWHFQVHRANQSTYGFTTQRIAGTSSVTPRLITNTAGVTPTFVGEFEIRWWINSASGYNDGLEITVMEIAAGMSAAHFGEFSVASGALTGTTLTAAQQGNMFAGDIVATDQVDARNGIILPASNNSAVYAVDASAGVTATLATDATYYPFGNANNFSGMLMVTNTTNNATGLFLVGSSSVVLVSDTSGSTYTVSSGTANRINVFLSSGAVRVENKITTQRIVRTIGVKIGTSA